MADSGNPVSKYAVKWQLALAVGLPVAFGVGYWYLITKGKKKSIREFDGNNKITHHETSIDVEKSTKGRVESLPKTALELATDLKEEGNKLFKSSKYEEAVASYEKAIATCPEKETISLATFYQNKAAAYEQLQKYEAVKEACTKALSYNPKYTKAFLRRAKACEQTKDLTQALEDVVAASILEDFQSLSTLQSADRILEQLGQKHAKEAMAKRVPVMPSSLFIKSYFISFTNDPINTFLNKTEENTSKGYLKAVECFKNDNFDSIIPACTEEINFTEAEAIYKNEALILRATFYQFTGENILAMSDLDMVIHNNDASPKLKSNALIKRASMHMQAEDFQSCLNDFNAAVAIDQDNPDVYYHRGQVNFLSQKLKEAIDDFKIAVALNPKNPKAVVEKCFAEYRMALMNKDLNSISKIKKRFEKLIEEFPDCSECYILFALIETDQQEFEKANKLFEEAIKIEPKNAILLVRQAILVLQWTGNVDTAVNYINEAIALDDKNEYAYETLGTIEVQRGNLTRAIEMFDKALALTKTESEMTRIFSLKDAAIAQKNVAEKMNMKLPNHFP